MKRALALAIMLGGCAERAPGNCDLAATRAVAFIGAEANDQIAARAFGPSCDKAVAVFALADADGHPVYAFAAPLPRVFGEGYLAPSHEEVEALLQRWTQARVASTADAPDWPQSMLHLPAGALIGLDRLTYEDIRARALPMLCHLASPGRETCVFYEPGAAGAGVLYERDIIAEPGGPEAAQ